MNRAIIRSWLEDVWLGISWSARLGFYIPPKCYSCIFHNRGLWCSSAERKHPKRFPFIHRFMSKDKPDGWMELPYKDNCIHYYEKGDSKMVKLGDKVKDTVSGFEGIAVARHSYLAGCDRFAVQPPIDKDGKLPESETFDEPCLEVTEVASVKVTIEPIDPGGPEKYMPKKRPGE